MYARLRQCEAVEAFDAQALPALEAGLAQYWYPQSLATAVIAVDRERTAAEIGGWRDLPAAGETVGFDGAAANDELLFAAIAYGLEGKDFTLGEAAKLLAGLRAKGLFAYGSFEAPVVICFEDRAQALGLEIVVPREGTLTYVRGLLSNHPLDLPGGAALKGTLSDFGHLNLVCRDAVRVMRRSVLRTRLYSSADGGEHQLFALLFIVLVTVWMAAVIRRAMQKGVRRASLLLGALLLGWIFTRALKYQVPSAGILNRYLWYGFYLFEMALPLTLLWLAWVIDNPEGGGKPPKWFVGSAVAGACLVAIVFTNDLHNWVFRLDLGNPNWGSEYGYGPAHAVFMAYCALATLAALVMMMLKVKRNPRKRGILFPVGFFVLLMVYLAAYALRVPLAWESDITITAGIFILLLLETSIRAGLIPVNSKYKLLFAHSPLAMQIIDSEDNVALSSVSGPLRRGGDTLLFAAPIAGGRVLWQEDITALNRLHREIEESVRKLTAANTMLAEEERIKRAVEEEKARAQLLSRLEAEIVGATARLSEMIERREGAARIALLVCYIKRRCNLFFRDRETRSLPADELAVYMDELAEFAGYAGLRIVLARPAQTPAEPRSEIVLRYAALIYDIFYSVIDWTMPGAIEQDTDRHMLASLDCGGGAAAIRLQCPEDIRQFRAEDSLAEAIASMGGALEVKDLGDAVGINLSFPEGGAVHG